MIAESNPDLLKTSFGKTVHDLVKSGKGGDAYNAWGQAMTERIDPLKGNEALTRYHVGAPDRGGRDIQ